MDWICSCGAVAAERLEYCPRCMRAYSYQPLINVPNCVVSAGTPIIKGRDLYARGKQGVKWPGTWATFFPEGVVEPFLGLFFGMPATGKSTAAMLLAHDCPKTVLYCSAEMGVGSSLQALMVANECYDFDVVAPANWDALREVAADYQVLVLDSVQALSLDPVAIRLEFIPRGQTILAISQCNAAGETRNGVAAQHEADWVCEFPEYSKFVVRKSRFGGLYHGIWRTL